MKISIIIATYNRAGTLGDTLQSILLQDYQEIECIVIDGGSTDGSASLIEQFEKKFNGRLKWISEPDNSIYDAMNKGLRLATGEVVGFLNSDDYYPNSGIISKIAHTLNSNPGTDAVYGNILYVAQDSRADIAPKGILKRPPEDNISQRLKYGEMPPHLTFFTYLKYYRQYGEYDSSYHISGDFDMICRLIHKHNLRCMYIDSIFVTMRLGGISSSTKRNALTAIKENRKVCRKYGIKTSYYNLIKGYRLRLLEMLHLRKKHDE